jgi:putative toxin-antitoxin system antitoxin component (TIGR02293 family)
MKKENTGKKPKKNAPYPEAEDTAPEIAEPAMAYGYVQDPITAGTIGLMGMNGKKDFAHINSNNDFIRLIRGGIPKEAMTNLMTITDTSLTEMAGIIHTTDRTLRRYASGQKLPMDQSEGVVAMAMLYSRGAAVFGSMDKFKEWMNTSLAAFGNKKPKEFLDTSLGIGMITDELGRIEHGIFA